MGSRTLIILLATLLLASGCSTTDSSRNEISRILAIRSNALNSKDISTYLSVISPQYNDKGKNFSLLKESLNKNFRDFEHVAYEAEAPAITITGNSAGSSCDYRLKVTVHGREISLKGTEHLKLAKEHEGWKIIAGI